MAHHARVRPSWHKWGTPRQRRRHRELWYRERRKVDLIARLLAAADKTERVVGRVISRMAAEWHLTYELRAMSARDRREWLEREARTLFASEV
jgi:hypothetical protein